MTEAEFAVDTIAAATAGGAALPTATWAAFAAAVIGESAEIRAATGAPGDRLGLTTASWMAIVGLLNPSAPAVLPSAGAPDFTAESLQRERDRRVPCTRPGLAMCSSTRRVSARPERPPEQVVLDERGVDGPGHRDHRSDHLPAPLPDRHPQVHRLKE